MLKLSEIKADMKKFVELTENELDNDPRSRLELEYRERCFLDKRDAQAKEKQEKRLKKKRRRLHSR